MKELNIYNKWCVVVLFLLTISVSFLLGLRSNISPNVAGDQSNAPTNLEQEVNDYFYFVEPLRFNFDIIPTNSVSFNQFDSANRKTGLWIESDDRNRSTVLTYYFKDEMNGLRQVYKNNRLARIMIYRKNISQTPYIIFSDSSLASYVITKIKPVEDFKDMVPEWWNTSDNPSTVNQAYSTAYSQNGQIINEGWIIFPKSLDEFNFMYVGNLLSYDSDSTKIVINSKYFNCDY